MRWQEKMANLVHTRAVIQIPMLFRRYATQSLQYLREEHFKAEKANFKNCVSVKSRSYSTETANTPTHAGNTEIKKPTYKTFAIYRWVTICAYLCISYIYG